MRLTNPGVVLLTALAWFYPGSSHANSCEALLADGVFDAYQTNTRHFTQSEFQNAMCNGVISHRTAGGAAGGGGTVSVGIPGVVDIGLGGDYATAKQFQDDYRRTFCQQVNSSNIVDSALQTFRRVASPTIVNAYIACVEAQKAGLKVATLRESDDVVTFVLSYPVSRSTAQFDALYVSPKDSAICRSPNLKTGSNLDSSTRSVTCSRVSGRKESFVVSIHTSVGAFTYLMPALPVESAKAETPIGAVLPFSGAQPPSGWRICDGSFLSKDKYASLYEAIGYTYGGRPSEGQFALPDLRGRFLRGYNGSAVGDGRDPEGSGRELGTLQVWSTGAPRTPFVAQSAGSHTHKIDFEITAGRADGGVKNTVANPNCCSSPKRETEGAGAHAHAISGGDSETRPTNVSVNYIIHVGIPRD